MEIISPTIPVDYRTLKLACRAGLNTRSRQYWHPLLLRITPGDAVTEEQDIKEVASRLAQMVKLDKYHPSAAGVEGQSASQENSQPNTEYDNKLTQVLAALEVAMQTKDGTKDISLVIPFMEFVCLTVKSVEVCYLMGADLTSTPSKFFAETSGDHAIRLEYFRALLQRYMPKTHAALINMGALSDAYLNLLFVNLFRGIVPTDIRGCILDAFMCEGWRIVLRFGLALFHNFKAEIKSQRHFKTATEMYKYLERQASNSPHVFRELIPNAYKIPHRGIQWVTRPVVVSTANIQEGLANTTVRRRNSSADFVIFDLENEDPSEDSPKKPVSPGSRARQQLQQQQQQGRNQLPSAIVNKSASDISNMSNMDGPPVSPTLHSPTSVVELLVQQSVILNDISHASFLLSTLPPPIQFKGLEIAFATRLHGFDLSTLYEKLNHSQECVLVIQTVGTKENSQVGDIIGAYISGPILPASSSKIKGNGMSYVFSVSRQQKFGWTDPTHTMHTAGSGPRTTHPNTVKQFSIFASDHFTIGASDAKSTNAIRVDEHLRICVCGESDTYNNPVLLTGKVSGGECKAEILEIEVYCPTGDLAKSQQRKR